MKKRTTRCLALLLAVVMVLSVMPVAMAEGTTQTATLVTDASTLKVGDQIILVAEANSKTYAAGALSGKLLTSVETSVTALADNVEIFTLGGEKDAWTLTGKASKKISTADAKALNNTGKGTSTWKISIDADGKATVASTDTSCGRILYNVNSPRFLNYTSATTISMLLPSIYRVGAAEPARKDGIIAVEDIKAGDTVVVFNPANGKTLSTEYSGFYNKGTDVTLEKGELTGWTEADLWTVGINEDGTFTFAAKDGQKLSMDTGYTSTPLGKANDTWKVTAVDGKDATYYIDNTGRTDKYRLQWFTNNNNWSAYTGTGAAFEQQFYLVVDSGEEPDPDPDPEPTPSALFKDGEQIVIYNPANMKALSTEYSGFYNKGTDVTLTNGTLTGYTEADVWTVGVNADGSYTFSTKDGKKLSMAEKYTSTPLDDVNTAWKVSEAATTGCYYIQNAVRGNYLEWYADKSNWSSYGSIGSNEALFAQAFYRVRKSGIVTSLSEGDTVVVFNPANMKALSTEYSGFYNKGTDVTLADGKLSGYTKADIWTVGVNADGTYTFSTSEGKKLSMGASYGSTPLDDVNTAWNVTAAKTENCFYIQNAVRGNYLEWYADKSNWSSYGSIGSNEALFAQQFYLVVDDGGSDEPSGDLPQPGDKFVIYNQNAQAVLAAENDSKSIDKADTEVKDGKATTVEIGRASCRERV